MFTINFSIALVDLCRVSFQSTYKSAITIFKYQITSVAAFFFFALLGRFPDLGLFDGTWSAAGTSS